MMYISCWIIEWTWAYAICHFVDQNLNDKPQVFLYGHGSKFINYWTDETCSLVWGWAKYTTMINGHNIPWAKPIPVMAMFDVRNIVGTCIRAKDSLSPIPQSYIFLPSCKNWPTFFKLHMIDLMAKEGEIVHEDCCSEIEEDNTEYEEDKDEDEDEYQ